MSGLTVKNWVTKVLEATGKKSLKDLAFSWTGAKMLVDGNIV